MAALQSVSFRPPTLEDGMGVFDLIAQCPPLDTNSCYCNLLQCSHFAETSVAAIVDDVLQGFISAYIVPARPNTLFVWQVAVASSARGVGLAAQMLESLISRPACADVHFIETSITEDNLASWSLFKGFAKRHAAALATESWMDAQQHFAGRHASEHLVRIGPF